MTQPIQDLISPCVRNCCLDDSDVCVGCGRSLVEITKWSSSSNLEKQLILSNAMERRQHIYQARKNPR